MKAKLAQNAIRAHSPGDEIGVKHIQAINVHRRGAACQIFWRALTCKESHMRFLFACSALLVALMGFGSSPASACDGYHYGYGCGCPGYGYAYYRPTYAYYYAAPAYYARPAYSYYAPRYYGRGWGYGPRAYWGHRHVGWRRW
jgi:hypothetical protein